MKQVRGDGLLVRQLLLGLLTAAAVVLTILYVTKQGRDAAAVVGRGDQEIEAAIDTMLQRNGIPPQWVRAWMVRIPGTSFSRVERRVWVPRGFTILRFNHELDQRLSGCGAKVVGLERTVQGTVTLHVVRDGIVVESLTLVPKPEDESGP